MWLRASDPNRPWRCRRLGQQERQGRCKNVKRVETPGGTGMDLTKGGDSEIGAHAGCFLHVGSDG